MNLYDEKWNSFKNVFHAHGIRRPYKSSQYAVVRMPGLYVVLKTAHVTEKDTEDAMETNTEIPIVNTNETKRRDQVYWHQSSLNNWVNQSFHWPKRTDWPITRGVWQRNLCRWCVTMVCDGAVCDSRSFMPSAHVLNVLWFCESHPSRGDFGQIKL